MLWNVIKESKVIYFSSLESAVGNFLPYNYISCEQNDCNRCLHNE